MLTFGVPDTASAGVGRLAGRVLWGYRFFIGFEAFLEEA